MLALKGENFINFNFFCFIKEKSINQFFLKFYYKSPEAFGIIMEMTIDRTLLHKPFLSPD